MAKLCSSDSSCSSAQAPAPMAANGWLRSCTIFSPAELRRESHVQPGVRPRSPSSRGPAWGEGAESGDPPFWEGEGRGEQGLWGPPCEDTPGDTGGLMEQEGPPYGDTPGDTGGLIQQEGPPYGDTPGDMGG